MGLHMLTTVDNPHDPFTAYDEWYAYDVSAGHHTTSLLARIVRTSHDLAPADEDAAIEAAIDEIVRLNVSGIYRKVEAPSS